MCMCICIYVYVLVHVYVYVYVYGYGYGYVYMYMYMSIYISMYTPRHGTGPRACAQAVVRQLSCAAERSGARKRAAAREAGGYWRVLPGTAGYLRVLEGTE